VNVHRAIRSLNQSVQSKSVLIDFASKGNGDADR